MTNQLQGETLFAGWAGDTSANWAYTPWLTVRGDFATFGVEVLVSSGATLDWGVETRMIDNSAVPVVILSGIAVAPPVVSITPVVKLGQNTVAAQELVRYRFKTGATASTANFVTFRALQPSWQVDR